LTNPTLLDFAQSKFAQPSLPNVVVRPINPINGSPNTKKIIFLGGRTTTLGELGLGELG